MVSPFAVDIGIFTTREYNTKIMTGYYIQLFSPHGLVRFLDPEIGRDKDTGGQVKYVLELLENLSLHPLVRKVDLFTRRVTGKKVSIAYEKEIEIVNDKARIIRMTCGGTAYRQKELLWDYLDEFVDKTIRFIEEENDFPDVVHGHYADGIYIADQLSEVFGIPFIATGHSLGRNKRSILLQAGLTQDKIDEKFNMSKRIVVEENMLQSADTIVVSTQHEIDTQYGLYENRNVGRYELIPPGVNTDLFFPFYRLDMPSFKMTIEQEQALYRVNSEIERFLFNPNKPLILSIGRADKRKNFEMIIQAYGKDKELQAMANLAIFAGVRKDITKMPEDEQELLTNLLLLLDKYDLYGKMAIPKKNDPRLEVPEIYRIAARKKGVFVNATPGENFGLTLVEAAACGLPVVASPSGGPKEILENCENGLLVDVEDTDAIATALKKLIADQLLWEKYSSNGITSASHLYSWATHTDRYVGIIQKLILEKNPDKFPYLRRSAYGKKMMSKSHLIMVDIDGTLVEGNDTQGLNELKQWIAEYKDSILFGVASGRNREITLEAFTLYDLPTPDVLICSAGSEIYYTERFIPDNGYKDHIDFEWKREELEKQLNGFSGLRLQEPAAQWPFKLSYYVDATFDEKAMTDLHVFLNHHKQRVKVLLTENRYLDILPFRASKGGAIRYLSSKWKIPLNQIITAGNSGNDIDMLKGKIKGIVVANYSREMEALREIKSIYFSEQPLSKGVLEGIKHHLASSQ